ncbi:MAG TPA: type III-A CRISPR-associated protein Csm2 [Deltaproteobacteria bacterium]|nr:type III-A CRISPR-associated protein Csm2 [Deltaproteobacteria bacterium]
MEKIEFYQDRARGVIKPTLFSDEAEKWATGIWASSKKKMKDGKEQLENNKRSQIRKFYDEVLRLNGNLKTNHEDWEVVLPYVNMLIAKAAYARGRNSLVTDEFVRMIRECVAEVQRPQDLDIFANFFEAFMGFYRQYD